MIVFWYIGLVLIFGTLIVVIASNISAKGAATEVRGTVCDVQRGMVTIELQMPLMQQVVKMDFDRQEIPDEFCQVGMQVQLTMRRGHAESVQKVM